MGGQNPPPVAPLSDLDRHACPGLRPVGRGAFFTNPLPPKGLNRRRLPGGQGQGVRHRPSSALICSTAAGPYSPGHPPRMHPPGGGTPAPAGAAAPLPPRGARGSPAPRGLHLHGRPGGWLLRPSPRATQSTLIACLDNTRAITGTCPSLRRTHRFRQVGRRRTPFPSKVTDG